MIEERDRSRMIGGIHLYLREHGMCVGYVLGRDSWGKGYMTEALGCVTNWGLAQNKIFRVYAYCDVDNVASAKVMEKVGMKLEGKLKRHSVHPNISAEPRDSFVYAKTR